MGVARPSGPRLFNWVNLANTPVGDDVAMRRPRRSSCRCTATSAPGPAADLVAGLMLLVIAVPEQLATSRLAGMPPITGFYAFVAGTVVFALLGSNPQMSVGADSTIAPLFATGVSALALTGFAPLRRAGGDPGRDGRADGDAGEHPAARLDRRVPVDAHRDRLPLRRRRDHHRSISCPTSSGCRRPRAPTPTAFGYVFTHLGQVNGWTVAIGARRPGRDVRLCAPRPPHSRWPHRPGRLHGARGGARAAGARRRRARHRPERRPAHRADRVVVVHACGAWRRWPPWSRWSS